MRAKKSTIIGNGATILMQVDSGTSGRPCVRRWMLGLLFGFALLARLPGINGLPDDFVAPREYHTAMLARALYVTDDPSSPEWMKNAAAGQLEVAIRAEPRIVEGISSRVYRLLGRESLAVPRGISIAAWMLAALFLYLLVRRSAGFEAAFVSAAFLLFHPYAFNASRSLLPDPLMIMGLVAAVFVIDWYDAKPSLFRWFVSILVSALAILVKPGAAQFCILSVYFFVSAARLGVRGVLLDWRTYVYPALALLPAAMYAFVGPLRVSGGPLFHTFFMPHVALTLYFWKGWIFVLLRVFGAAALLLGILGLFLLPKGRLSVVGFALCAGYVAECFLRTYTTPSHDHWHLEAFPLASLGVGAVGGLIWARLAERSVAVKGLAASLAALWLGAVTVLHVVEMRGRDSGDYPAIAREIGEAVQHSARTVYLDYNYGWPLCYFGFVSGHYWPDRTDMWTEATAGLPPLSARERFEKYFSHGSPEYFIVCRRLDELNAQDDLKRFLDDNARVLVENPRYVIFDLRKPAGKRPSK